MADNVQLNQATTVGSVISTDELAGGIQVQRVKIQTGVDGTSDDVNAANPLPITATTLPLPSGAATEAGNLASILAKLSSDPATQTTLAAILAKIISAPATAANQATEIASLANLDVALSSRTKPADQQHTIIDSGTTAVTQATGTNLHTVVDSGTVAISAGAAVIGHVIADTGSTTAVTGNVTVVQGTGTNLHTVIDSGTTVVTQGTGTNLHTVLDSGTLTTVSTVTAVTAITNPLPAGTNVIGHVINDTGSTTAVTGNVATTVADAANVVEGAIADAIVAAGATGSISAKLRRATQGLEDLKSLIVLAAGTNLIGKVGIDQTTQGTTNAVVLRDTTGNNVTLNAAYTASGVADTGVVVNISPNSGSLNDLRRINENPARYENENLVSIWGGYSGQR